MRKREKLALSLSLFMALGAGVTRQAGAMHIMEGFLPPSHCVAWGVICLPFLVWGVIRIKNITRDHRKALLLLAMCGAYAFVLSALKIPSVTGSSSHPTGTGLGAMLFGPSVMAVLGIIVLLFQALLLAHGGLTTPVSYTHLFAWNDMYYDNTYPGEEDNFSLQTVGYVCEWETWSDSADWSTPELQEAADAGLIPDVLVGKDMTAPVTRGEFARCV